MKTNTKLTVGMTNPMEQANLHTLPHLENTSRLIQMQTFIPNKCGESAWWVDVAYVQLPTACSH